MAVNICNNCEAELAMDRFGYPENKMCPKCGRKVFEKTMLKLTNVSDWVGRGKGKDGPQREHMTLLGFRLAGDSYRLLDDSFRYLLRSVCRIVMKDKADAFFEAIEKRELRDHFGNKETEVKEPQRVGDGNVWVTGAVGGKKTKQILRDLLESCGYNRNHFEVVACDPKDGPKGLKHIDKPARW